MQRFIWDLQYPNPPADNYTLPISAIYKDTPFVPEGPFVMPGNYTLKLTVGGRTYTQPLTIKIDPRITTPLAGLQQQFALSMQSYEGIKQTYIMQNEAKNLQAQLKTAREKGTQDDLKKEIEALEQKLNAFINGNPATPTPLTDFPLNRLNGAFRTLLDLLQDADATPTTQAIATAKDLQTALSNLQKRWSEIKEKDINALNEKLKQASIQQISL